MIIQLMGDLHLSDVNPVSRTDNYFQAILNKLDFLLSQTYDVAIFSGDIFNKINISKYHLKEMLSLLYKYKDRKIYSIIGNHDVIFGDTKYIDNTPLGILFASGLIKHLKQLDYADVTIYGNDYGEELPLPLANGKKSLLVAHRYFNYGEEADIITEADVKKYDYVFLGHDHEYYPEQPLGKSVLFRCGSVCRNTVKDISKTPKYYCFDTSTTRIALKDIPFTKEVFNELKNDIKHEIKEITKKETKVLNFDTIFDTEFNNFSPVVKNRFKELWNGSV